MIEIIKQCRRDLLFKFRLRPIDSVFRTLRSRKLSAFNFGLEVFGFTGEYHTKNYQHLVRELHVWEIDQSCEPKLKQNLPGAIIKITDSFKEIQNTEQKYDLIVIDNPLSFYVDHCEHFEIFPLSLRILNNNATIIINIITNVNVLYDKYRNYDSVKQNEVRNKWYSSSDATILKDEFVLDFYKQLCEKNGFKTNFSFLKKRNNMVSYLVMNLNKATS